MHLSAWLSITVFISKHYFLIQLEDRVHQESDHLQGTESSHGIEKKIPFPSNLSDWWSGKGIKSIRPGCVCLLVMEHKTHLGLTCWEIQMKVSLKDVSFSQTPKLCMVRRPEETPAVTRHEDCTAGMGSINKHHAQKILLCRTVCTLPGKWRGKGLQTWELQFSTLIWDTLIFTRCKIEISTSETWSTVNQQHFYFSSLALSVSFN